MWNVSNIQLQVSEGHNWGKPQLQGLEGHVHEDKKSCLLVEGKSVDLSRRSQSGKVTKKIFLQFPVCKSPPLLSLQNFALFPQYGPKITTQWPQKTIVFHTLSAQFSNSLGKAPISLEMSPMLREVRGTQLWVWEDKTKIRCFYEKPFMILNGFIISKYGFNMFYSLMSNMFVKF